MTVAHLQSVIAHYLYQHSVLNYAMYPLACCYQLIIWIRKKLYEYGFYKKNRIDRLVIVVGNITLGGTGKTPFVIWLAKTLCANGYHPGIISRGYKSKKNNQPTLVSTNSHITDVGDEALILAKHSLCPLVIARNRVAAAQHLIARVPDCDVIISDDGLQHYALERDIEILLVDGLRKFGNGLCLPAGPLREPISRTASVDIVVSNQVISDQSASDEYCFQLAPLALCSVSEPSTQLPISALKDQSVHAVAGIGHPQQFFSQLRAYTDRLIEHAFPDHHCFQPDEIDFPEANFIVMTEKDAVKCTGFANQQCWYVSTEVKVSAGLWQRLHELLQQQSSAIG